MRKKTRGFTDKLAMCIVAILVVCIAMSYNLAKASIESQYMGALACWTACMSPLAVGLDIVLNSVVNKNRAENTGKDGEGIRYHQLTNGGSEPTI